MTTRYCSKLKLTIHIVPLTALQVFTHYLNTEITCKHTDSLSLQQVDIFMDMNWHCGSVEENKPKTSQMIWNQQKRACDLQWWVKHAETVLNSKYKASISPCVQDFMLNPPKCIETHQYNISILIPNKFKDWLHLLQNHNTASFKSF